MDNYVREKTSAIWRQEKKKNDENERHFQVGYIHNPVKRFWVLRLITCFNIGNNYLIFYPSFHVHLWKLAMVLRWIKKNKK